MTNTNNFIEQNSRYLINDMIDSVELCFSHHIDKQTRSKLYNELSEKLCKWGVTKRSIPLIEYCFKLYINDKACFGNFNVKAENLEEAYDIAYTTLASKLSGILPDIDIPYYVEAIKEEDLQFLAESAAADACAPGNPKDASVEDFKELFRRIM